MTRRPCRCTWPTPVPPSRNCAWNNHGNTPVAVVPSAQGASERVKFVLEPAELTIPGGETKLARLNARSARRLWRGAPTTHPFQIVVALRSDEDGPAQQPTVLDGTYEQQALLPRRLPKALAAAVLLAGVLVGLWFGLLRPTVQSAARDAVTPDAIRSAADATSAGAASTGASSGATAGPGTSAGAGGASSATASGGAGTPTAPGAPGSAPPGGTGAVVPHSARVRVLDSVGGGAETGTAYTVKNGQSFGLTDIVVQNPQGDSGTLVVATQDGQILSPALEDFRASDYHFVTPVEVPARAGSPCPSTAARSAGR